MTVCKLCGSEQAYDYKKVTSPVNSLSYTLFKCRKCGSNHFLADEHEVDLQTMYDGFVSRADFPLEFTPSRKWETEKRRVEKILRHPANSVLDVGCRTGDFLMHFPEGSLRVGIELSTDFADIATRRGLKIYTDFIENINLSESFDVVSCYAILEHLEKPLVFIDSLTSLVKEKGVLVIMIPSHQTMKTRVLSAIKSPWHMHSPPEHLNFYSRYFLDSYLKEKGFKKVSRRYSSGGMLFFQKGILAFIEKYIALLIDRSFLSRIPIFDHMYSYYVKV